VQKLSWLTSIRGEHVAFTGKAWRLREELERAVRRRGGHPCPRVTGKTTVLVRGESQVWAFRKYGLKEKKAAELIRRGHEIRLVHDFEFRKLLEDGRHARVSDYIAGQPVQWLQHVSKKKFEQTAVLKGPLDREHSVKGRLEQGYLRYALFGDEDVATCAVCGRSLPVGLMVAAHIKPRGDCSRRERLDAANIVVPLCALGCDTLYERGLIAVADRGEIVTSSVYRSRPLKRVLRSLKGRTCSGWRQNTADYFKWHLKRRFQS
jgi:hypothetical protein